MHTVKIYTTAPRGYDWTVESSAEVEPRREQNCGIRNHNNPLREVVVEKRLADLQLGRYISGLFVATEDRDIAFDLTSEVVSSDTA